MLVKYAQLQAHTGQICTLQVCIRARKAGQMQSRHLSNTRSRNWSNTKSRHWSNTRRFDHQSAPGPGPALPLLAAAEGRFTGQKGRFTGQKGRRRKPRGDAVRHRAPKVHTGQTLHWSKRASKKGQKGRRRRPRGDAVRRRAEKRGTGQTPLRAGAGFYHILAS